MYIKVYKIALVTYVCIRYLKIVCIEIKVVQILPGTCKSLHTFVMKHNEIGVLPIFRATYPYESMYCTNWRG